MRTIDRPGIYDLTMAEYLADPVGPAPSLSASIAHLLISRSPAHAKRQHPRLTPDYIAEESDAFDLGTAAHAYVLEGGFNLEIIDALDWRTQAARAARDAARAAGKTPVLAHRFVLVQAMAEAAREQLARHAARPIPLTNGQAERTLVWQEEGVWCRARLDWLHADHRVLDDYKTCQNANPEAFTRSLFAFGYSVQAAFYLRGMAAVFGEAERAFRFIAQETSPPYALAVMALAPDAMVLAEKQVQMALKLWRECLSSGEWPSYEPRIAYADVPAWIEAAWLAKEVRAEEAA